MCLVIISRQNNGHNTACHSSGRRRICTLAQRSPSAPNTTLPQVLANPDSFDVAVTTYDMIHSAHFGDALKHSIVWRYVVLDEAHKVKNEESLISQAMRKISRQHTLMLTGEKPGALCLGSW